MSLIDKSTSIAKPANKCLEWLTQNTIANRINLQLLVLEQKFTGVHGGGRYRGVRSRNLGRENEISRNLGRKISKSRNLGRKNKRSRNPIKVKHRYATDKISSYD